MCFVIIVKMIHWSHVQSKSRKVRCNTRPPTYTFHCLTPGSSDIGEHDGTDLAKRPATWDSLKSCGREESQWNTALWQLNIDVFKSERLGLQVMPPPEVGENMAILIQE